MRQIRRRNGAVVAMCGLDLLLVLGLNSFFLRVPREANISNSNWTCIEDAHENSFFFFSRYCNFNVYKYMIRHNLCHLQKEK